MLAACPNCGGTAEIKNEAIREGLATCTYCHAHIVVASSEHPLQLKIEAEKAKLKIRRKGDTLSITGRRPFGGGQRLDLRECVIGSVPGIYVCGTVFLSSGNPLAALIAGFVVFLLVGVVASFFRFYSPPLILTPFQLESGLLGANDYLRDEIRQLYAVSTILDGDRPGSVSTVHHNICVLARDGRREIIFGPARTIEIALAIEQVLEDELGLYNLRVKGDERTETVDSDRPRQTLKLGDTMVCQVCAAESKPSAEDWKRGFLNCDYCDHLSALYEEGGARVVLGDETLSVVFRESDAGLIYVDAPIPFVVDPSVRELRFGEPEQDNEDRVAFSDVQGVSIRRVGGLGPASSGGVIDRMKYAQARSGRISSDEIFGAALNLNIEDTTYSLMLHMRAGLDRVLVADLTDAKAAFDLKSRLDRVFSTEKSSEIA